MNSHFKDFEIFKTQMFFLIRLPFPSSAKDCWQKSPKYKLRQTQDSPKHSPPIWSQRLSHDIRSLFKVVGTTFIEVSFLMPDQNVSMIKKEINDSSTPKSVVYLSIDIFLPQNLRFGKKQVQFISMSNFFKLIKLSQLQK